MSNVVTYPGYFAYLEELAKQHVDISHTADAPRFFRMTGNEYLLGKKRSHTMDVFMIAEHPTVDPGHSVAENNLQLYEGAFVIAVNTRRGDDIDEMNANYDQARSICEDMIRRMRHDWHKRKQGVEEFKLPETELMPVDIRKVYGAVGYRCTFQMLAYWDVSIDESKWNDGSSYF